MKILIVEDTLAIAQAYKLIINADGYKSFVANTPSHALQLITKHKFQLMFIDLMLPEANGVELVHQIRELGITTPIVISTNMSSGYDKTELIKLDVADFIMKATAGPQDIRNILAKYA